MCAIGRFPPPAPAAPLGPPPPSRPSGLPSELNVTGFWLAIGADDPEWFSNVVDPAMAHRLQAMLGGMRSARISPTNELLDQRQRTGKHQACLGALDLVRKCEM